MTVIKWKAAERRYEPYELPDGARTICEEFDEMCRCAQCGKELRFGDTFTSLEVHTEIGIGFGVCEKCHYEEIGRRMEARK